MTNIKLHGILGDYIGKEWNLQIKSVSEAIRAIHILSGRRLFPFLKEKDKESIQYQVLINGRNFETKRKLNADNLEDIKNSELCLKKNIKTIDIIPVLEGADRSVLAIVLGVVLIIVGIIVYYYGGDGSQLIIAGVGLILAGVINLLTEPPKFDDYNEIGGLRRNSYLFEGGQNTSREGIAVPIGYGRLLIGSAVVSATYEIDDIPSSATEITQ